MQSFPNIPPDNTLTESRQKILDRDEALASCFSGEQFPSLNLAEGMLCYSTDLKQMYQLKSVEGPTWRLIANLDNTLTSKEEVDEGNQKLEDKLNATKDELNSNLADLENQTINTLADHQEQIYDNQAHLAELDNRCDGIDNDIQKQDSTLRNYIDNQLITVAPPTASIILYGGAAIPEGWLECNGQAVSRTSYPDLYGALYSGFGSGDGGTTFNLPDMRGRVPIGVGLGAGLTNRSLSYTYGAETHTLTASEMPSHVHDEIKGWNGGPPYTSKQWAGFSQSGNAGPNRVTGPTMLIAAGGNAPHNNIQPSLGLIFIIKT